MAFWQALQNGLKIYYMEIWKEIFKWLEAANSWNFIEQYSIFKMTIICSAKTILKHFKTPRKILNKKEVFFPWQLFAF